MDKLARAFLIVGLAAVSAYMVVNGDANGGGWAFLAILILILT